MELRKFAGKLYKEVYENILLRNSWINLHKFREIYFLKIVEYKYWSRFQTPPVLDCNEYQAFCYKPNKHFTHVLCTVNTLARVRTIILFHGIQQNIFQMASFD